MQRLAGRTAVISGAGRGIGAAAARLFAAEGAFVVIAERDIASGQAMQDEIRNSGGQALFLACDVSRGRDVQAVVAAVERQLGRLDILYNNASVYLPGRDGRVTAIREEDWDMILGVNLRSVYLFCHYGIPLMLKHGGGRIINTASSAGLIGIPECDAYTASKGATVQLTKSLAVEYGPLGIGVNCLAPAAIMTPMMRQSNPVGSAFDEERFLKLRTPLRRYGTPEEIARVALFLASSESSYLNGAVIVADGGITINGDLAKPDS
ncbi:MAG: glucose 1-dehydrogenase [Lentisphaeria bacterium]|nr:glucose 1-dehydrogenase [Lentisphaeria bacterium]